MNKYQIKNSIGNGNFSTVYKVEDPTTKNIYALKVMKTHHKIALREAKILSRMNHPNVIKLIDFEQNENQSKLMLQFVGINTLELYESHAFGLREQQVKCILFQAALGLHYVHQFGIINRDVKPENILIDKKNALVKIIDFGLAISEQQVSTDYIATRWYRAPENLLGTKEYKCSVDVFSLGCVIVELYLGGPLFPGTDNVDQIYKIFNILGYPTQENWPLGYRKAQSLGIKTHDNHRTSSDLKTVLNPCNPQLLEILEKMLEMNPANRMKCIDIVKHPYFKDVNMIVPPFVYHRFQEDHLNKPPTSNTTQTKTSSSEVHPIQNKSKAQKLTFKGLHQLKQPKTGKEILESNGSLQANKLHFLTNNLKHADRKSQKSKQILISKKNSSLSSHSNDSFKLEVSRNESFQENDLPSKLTRNRNKTDHQLQAKIIHNSLSGSLYKDQMHCMGMASSNRNYPINQPRNSPAHQKFKIIRNYSEDERSFSIRANHSTDRILPKCQTPRKQLSQIRTSPYPDNSYPYNPISPQAISIRVQRAPAVTNKYHSPNHQQQFPQYTNINESGHQHQHQRMINTENRNDQSSRNQINFHSPQNRLQRQMQNKFNPIQNPHKFFPKRQPGPINRQAINLQSLNNSPNILNQSGNSQGSFQLQNKIYVSPERQYNSITPFSPALGQKGTQKISLSPHSPNLNNSNRMIHNSHKNIQNIRGMHENPNPNSFFNHKNSLFRRGSPQLLHLQKNKRLNFQHR